jgi:hypothetical protein
LEDNKPPILNSKNIALITKIIAIYAAFYLCVIIVQLFVNPLDENPLTPQNAYDPIYFMAAVHLIVLAISGWSVLKKKFHWIVALVCAVLVAFSRFYYNEIAEYIWGLTTTVS